MSKKFFGIVATLAVAATGAIAGAVAYVAPAAPVMVEEPSGSMGGSGMWLLPLIAIALIAVAIGSRENESDGGGSSAQVSDRRMKRNIKEVGMSEIGLPIYEFSYIFGTKTHTGVMAQDVLKHTPDAVVRSRLGYYKVNYDALGLEMTTVH